MSTSSNKIECLVDAIANLYKFQSPDSIAYKLRNPILLKSFSKSGKHDVAEDGVRIFSSHIGGYKSAFYDIELKIKGESKTGLKPTDKLKNLLTVLGINKEEDVLTVVYFLRKALDKSIDASTTLSYFVEN